MQAFTLIGQDPDNPATHVIIRVRGTDYSVYAGTEQETASEIAANLDA